MDGEERHELGGGWVVPGFIDLHMHGGGGHATLSADPDEIASAAAFHRAHGTTGSLASIVSAPLGEMLAALEAVRDAVPSVIGSHLEGPFLSPLRAGAHDPAHLLPPDSATFERMLDVAGGTLRVITVAPELPGGMELVNQAVAAGVVVAVGHSDADHQSRRRDSMPAPHSSRTCSTRCVPGITASRGWSEPPSRAPTSSAS